MNSTDKKAFVDILTSVAQVYNRKMSDILFNQYWRTLKDYLIEVIDEAFARHVSDPDKGQYMPLPADIIRLIHGNSGTQALLAWTKVNNSIRYHGAYESVVFDDPLIHAVIADMGGWIQLCRANSDTLSYRAHEFERRYSHYLQHKPHNYPKHLVGMIEHQNQASSYAIPKPLFLGDRQKALLVHEGSQDVTMIRTSLSIASAADKVMHSLHLSDSKYLQSNSTSRGQYE